MKNNKGFSLVELIVVIAIMAILAAVAIPTFATFIDKANVASDVSFVNDAEYAAELANAVNGTDIKRVYVTVAEKKAASITVVFEGETSADTDDEIVVVDKNTKTGWAADIASAIDWDYNFKKYSANGSYELNAEGKDLATATVITPPTQENN
jgi:type IV pilus assembly protein PilA